MGQRSLTWVNFVRILILRLIIIPFTNEYNPTQFVSIQHNQFPMVASYVIDTIETIDAIFGNKNTYVRNLKYTIHNKLS
jgi:hypothetical protein